MAKYSVAPQTFEAVKYDGTNATAVLSIVRGTYQANPLYLIESGTNSLFLYNLDVDGPYVTVRVGYWVVVPDPSPYLPQPDAKLSIVSDSDFTSQFTAA